MRRRILATLLVLVAASATAFAAPIRLRTGEIEPAPKAKFSTDSTAVGVDKPRYYIVQFNGPVSDEWKSAVTGEGAEIGEYVPEYAFVVKMTRAQAKRVHKLDFVSFVDKLAPERRIDSGLRATRRDYSDVVIRLFDGELSATLERVIRSGGGVIFRKSELTDSYIRAIVPTSLLASLSAIESVEWIEEWKQPKLANNVAQGLVGLPEFRTRAGFYGEGQIIAVSDTGLDTGSDGTLSADFSGRLVNGYAMRRTDWGDPHGHGTHVSGIAAGSGVLSGSNPASHSYTGSYAGVAPESGLVMQSIGDANGFIYPPLNLATLFSPAYDDGARIHSNSWGTPGSGQYSMYSQQVDEFCWNHKDFVVLFAAGNDARDANKDGITDLSALYSPGTAKNCITVGATESVRQTGGKIATYGGVSGWPDDFSSDPIRTDYISDTPSSADRGRGMVAWSGRGPCQDGRIKPDICAPGTNIASARSHIALTTGWGAINSNYMYWGGTSMSTPMVAGAAALVREYYMKSRGSQPSAALIKATLLNGAKDIFPGQYGSGTKKEIPFSRPNNVEGWGLLNFASNPVPTLPRVLASADEVAGISTGGSRTYVYNVLGSAEPLAVTLVWTDPAPSTLSGKQLVNNLDLTVTGPTGTLYRGNGTSDNTNNVESVDIASPVSGSYTVTVSGTNVPSGPQPFALAISGMLPSGYGAGTVTTASGAPVQGATITATGSEGSQTISTGASGSYTMPLSPGTYTITPSKTGWTFDPTSREITVTENPVTGVDFVGTGQPGSVSGTITQAVGGRVGYILETEHPYSDAAPIVYTITGHPGASQIRVHFEEIALLNNTDLGHIDYLYVETPDGTIVNTYTGDASDVWSNWVSGNTLKVVLVPDASYVGPGFWGFYISGYETNTIANGPLAGVTVTAEPGGHSAVTQADGTYSFAGLEPVTYTVAPALAHWIFNPDIRTVSVPSGGATGGVDFLASPPGSVSGTVTSSACVQQSILVQSTHPYANNATIPYAVQAPVGAPSVRVHFSSLLVESGFDYVYVLDGNDNVVDEITGDLVDMWSSWIPGDHLTVQLASDEMDNDYGFVCDKIEYLSGQHPVAGINVAVSGISASARTGVDGTYLVSEVDEGKHVVTAAKPYWTFNPLSKTVNVVRGIGTQGVNFAGLLGVMPSPGPMPSLAYVKTLGDNEEVSLAGKVVSGGVEDFGNHFYIQETDRSSGIRVVSTENMTRGKVVTLQGTIGTAPNGERQITPFTLTAASTLGTVPKPLGMTVRTLGGGGLFDAATGAGQRGIPGGVGLNNIGMLVRVVGLVTKATALYFYIDDGSGAQDNSPYKGVRIDCENVLSPNEGQFVAVTGISSLISSGGQFYRTVRPRDIWDMDLM